MTADPVAPRGSTRVAAVIGDPVAHSLSPVLHNAGFRAAGLDWVYGAFPVPQGQASAALDAMRTLGLAGLSVTMPHKQAVAEALVGRLSGAAASLGAVNCVRWDNGQLVGENTDGDGFVNSLRRELGVDPSGASVAVIGAGGAGRAVVAALAGAGASRLVIINRDRARAERAATLGGRIAEVGDHMALPEVDIIVNATSVGMGRPAWPDPVLPLDSSALRPDQVVADLVYQPVRTGLLHAAEGAGCRTLNGVGMLLYQAVSAFELWTGHSAPVSEMRAAVEAQLIS
ncbi:MAG: shikimate dehydrogenase [Acidimicrobiales bacterium]